MIAKDQFPISPKAPLKQIFWPLTGALVIILFTVVTAGQIIFSNSSLSGYLTGYIFLMVFIVVLGIALNFVFWKIYLNNLTYDLTPEFFSIKKGIFSKEELNVPFDKIQDVFVDQDVLDRFLGLYDLHISSATIPSGVFAHIDGLGKEASDGLKSALFAKMSKDKS